MTNSNTKRNVVTVIDTKPSDKALFKSEIGGHKFTCTEKAYQSMVLNNPNRYKLADGSKISGSAAAKIDVSKNKTILESKDVTSRLAIKEAGDLLKTAKSTTELDAMFAGEIRPKVIKAYQEARKKLTGK